MAHGTGIAIKCLNFAAFERRPPWFRLFRTTASKQAPPSDVVSLALNRLYFLLLTPSEHKFEVARVAILPCCEKRPQSVVSGVARNASLSFYPV